MKQDVTGKVGESISQPVASYPGPSNQVGGIPYMRHPDDALMPESAVNRLKARGQLQGASIGTFMTSTNDEPHATTKVRQMTKSPTLVAPIPMRAKENSRGPQANNREGVHGDASRDLSAVDRGLIELVYKNNAESQRRYLEFSPY